MSTNPNPFGGGGGQQPYQFQPESYGARGNGRVVSDVVTNSTAVITSATAAWSNADVGKSIMINGANGTTSAPVIGTILSFQSATQVTLSVAATVTTTGCQAVWGTDDTAAFQSAFAAAKAYAVANNFRAQVICGAKIYIIAAAPTQSTGPTYNSQIQIPFNDLTGATQKLMIDMIGSTAGHAGTAQFFQSSTPNLAGTCLVSMQTAPVTPDPTFGVQSVLGGPSGGSSFTAGFANTHFHIDGVEIFCPIYTNIKAYNFGFLAGASWGSFAANIFAPANQGTHPQLTDLPAQVAFQSTRGVGCIFPYTGNNDDVAGTRFAVEGYETGLVAMDHFSCLNVLTVYVDVGILMDSTQGASGNANLLRIVNWSCEVYNGGLLCNGGNATIDVHMTTETPGGADPTYDVKDQGSNLHGVALVTDNAGRTNRRPVISNCANLKVINNMIGPGTWAAAPAAPTSGTAQQNTAWRDATVYVSSTVPITAVVVAGVTTGQTAAAGTIIPVRVPSGLSYTITAATGTQTTHWVLD